MKLRLGVLAALALAACKPAPKGGRPAPDVPLSVLDGPKIERWSDLKAELVVAEFWATWCEPCVAELPHWNKLVDESRDLPVAFVSISDEPEGTVREFLKAHAMKGHVVAGGDAAFQAFKVRGRPTTLLLKDGKVAASLYPSEISRRTLVDALAGRTPERAEPQGPGESGSLFSIVIASAAAHGGYSSGEDGLVASGISLSGAIEEVCGLTSARVRVGKGVDDRLVAVRATGPAERRGKLCAAFLAAVEASFPVSARRKSRQADALIARLAAGAAEPAESASPEGELTLKGGELTVKKLPLSVVLDRVEQAVEKPIFDESGLKGRYDAELKWDPKAPQSAAAALRKALNVELVPARRTVEVVELEKSL